MTALPTRASRAGLAAAALLVLTALAAPAPARAQSRSDAFAGRVPPVAGQLYRKDGRLEITLTGNLSLNDAFWKKYFGGVKLGYHLTEFLSVSAQYQAGMTGHSGSAVVCPSGSGCQDAPETQMWQVPGKLSRVIGGEIAWSPIYGKLNVASERVAHFDLALLAGGDLISYQTVVSDDEVEALLLAGKTPGTTSTFGGHVGLGVRLFLTEWMAARLEVKDYLYVVPVPNWKEGRSVHETLQNQIFTELGLSFFLPLHNRQAR